MAKKEDLASTLRQLAEEASWWADEIETSERPAEAASLVQKYVDALKKIEKEG